MILPAQQQFTTVVKTSCFWLRKPIRCITEQMPKPRNLSNYNLSGKKKNYAGTTAFYDLIHFWNSRNTIAVHLFQIHLLSFLRAMPFLGRYLLSQNDYTKRNLKKLIINCQKRLQAQNVRSGKK